MPRTVPRGEPPCRADEGTTGPTRRAGSTWPTAWGSTPICSFLSVGRPREAKEVCRGCVVRQDCLEYALAHGEKFGIWGGMSERERRRVRRARAHGATGQSNGAASA